ncbi:MAG: globin, partial [Rhodocyclales bacterium]|nr:globin [Rhodocyclales bacterium]
MIDLEFPPLPTPAPAVFAALGEAPLRELVRIHHDRLRASGVGHLFPAESKHFAAVVDRIADYFVATAAGPSAFTRAHGPTWLRSQHFPITIDETARNIWLAELLIAFDEAAFPEAARLAFWNWVEALSIFLINRRTMITQPRRYPLAEA